MKRFAVLAIALAFLVSYAGFAGGKAESKPEDKKIVLKFAHHLAVDHSGNQAALKLAKYCSEKTNGRLEIQNFPGSQMGGLKDNTEGVRMGTLDMTWVDFGTISLHYPLAGFSGLPFLYRDYDHVFKVFDGPIGSKIVQDIEKATKIKIVGLNVTGFRNIVSKKPIKTVDDMKLLKIRVMENPIMVGTMKAFGANPTPMPWGEVYTALQTGVVEAADSPFQELFVNKTYEVTKYLIVANYIFQDVHIVINGDVYAKFPADVKKVFDEGLAMVTKEKRAFDMENAEKFHASLVKAGMQEITPDMAEFRSRVKVVWDDFAKKNNAQDLIEAIVNTK